MVNVAGKIRAAAVGLARRLGGRIITRKRRGKRPLVLPPHQETAHLARRTDTPVAEEAPSAAPAQPIIPGFAPAPSGTVPAPWLHIVEQLQRITPGKDHESMRALRLLLEVL